MANRIKIHVEAFRGIPVPEAFQDKYYASRDHAARVKLCSSCPKHFYDESPRRTHSKCSDCRLEFVNLNEALSEEAALAVPGRQKTCLHCLVDFLDQSLPGARNYCRRCLADYSYDVLEANKKSSIKVAYVFDAKAHVDSVRNSYDGIRSDLEIGKIIGITGDQVGYIRRKFLEFPRVTLDSRRTAQGFKSLDSIDKDSLENKIRVFGESYDSMASEYGVKASTIRLKRKELGARPKFDVFPDPVISNLVHQYLVGHLLGDGMMLLAKSGLGAKFRLSHKLDHKSYTKMSQDAFGNLVSRVMDDEARGRVKDLDYGFVTHSSSTLVPYFHGFYDLSLKGPGNDCDFKRPNMSYFENLTPLSLALWYQDDGEIDFVSETISIACNFRSFNYDKMCEKLSEKFGIQFYNIVRGPKLCMLHIRGSKDRTHFFELIHPYVHEKMSYKLPRSVYDRNYQAFEGSDPLTKIFNPEKFRDMLESDQHNYLETAVSFVLEQPFPFPIARGVSLMGLKEQMKVSSMDRNLRLPSGFAYGLDYLDETFPHRFTANHDNKPSPVLAWKNSEWVRKSFLSMARFNTPVTLQKLRARISNLVNAPGHFKPASAAAIYNTYKPRSVLDPMIGWGARSLAAMMTDVKKYVGIDLQQDSVSAVGKMYSRLKSDGLTNTNISAICGDALQIMKSFGPEFDLVMAGPPYFKTENYNGFVPKGSFQDWIQNFVDPFCFLISKVLRPQGLLVLHIFDTYKHGFIEPFLEKCSKHGLRHKEQLIYGNVSSTENSRLQYVHVFKKFR